MTSPGQITVARRTVLSSTRMLWWALAWTVVFTAMHGYWYLGGKIGLGDAPSLLPAAPASPGGWAFTIVVALMFAVGLAVPIALLLGAAGGAFRRLLVALLWPGCRPRLTQPGPAGNSGITQSGEQETAGVFEAFLVLLWAADAGQVVLRDPPREVVRLHRPPEPQHRGQAA